MSRSKYFRTLPTFVVALIVAAALALGAYVTPLMRAFAEGTAELSSVIDKDESGKAMMYTTLYDKDGVVIDSNDVNYPQADKYKDGTTTVGKEDGITVHFRIASIIPNDGASGVQKDTIYTMDLPSELTPTGDLIGTDSVFFTSGKVTATGGVYEKSNKSGYELRIKFENVEDQIDISGEFQYTTTPATNTEAGSTVEVKDAPGGDLSFKLTPPPAPEPEVDYKLEINGSHTGTYGLNLEWSAKAQALKDTFAQGTLDITLDEGAGFLVDGTEKTYRLKVKTKDGTESELTATSSSPTATFTLPNGKTATLSLSAENALDGLVNANSNAYITQKAELSLPEDNDLASVELVAVATPYNDYEVSGDTSYQGTATLKVGSDTLTANNTTSIAYASLSTPSVSSGAISGSSEITENSYELLPEKIYTHISSDSTQAYAGNYYWLEYDPATTNNANADYYSALSSFLEKDGNKLTTDKEGASVSKSSNEATFSSDNTYLVTTSGQFTSWTYMGAISPSDLNSSDYLSNSALAKSADDIKLLYQLKQVFKDSASNGKLIIYRSAETLNGKYVYIVVDPNTNFIAKNCSGYGWNEYVEAGDINNSAKSNSKKAAAWKLHVFNAPHSKLELHMYQHLGALVSNDQNGDGSTIGSTSSAQTIRNTAKNGYFGNESNNASSAGAEIKHTAAAYINPVWVNDDEIFWEFSINMRNWPELKDSYLYLASDSQITPCEQPDIEFTFDECTIKTGHVYVLNNGSWQQVGNRTWSTGAPTQTSTNDLYFGTTLKQLDNTGSSRTYYNFMNLGDLTQYRGSNNQITIGFFTHVNSSYEDWDRPNGHQLSAELVAQAADVSHLGSADGSSFPTSAPGNSTRPQYPFKISASGATKVPTVSKNSKNTAGKDTTVVSGETTTTTWSLDVTDFLEARSVNSSLFRSNAMVGGYSGNLTIGDSMQRSSISDAAGKQISDAYAGKYTYITQFIASSANITEAQGGAGFGPIPTQGKSGDTSWQKWVNNGWVSTNQTDTYWNPKEAGIFRHSIGNQITDESGKNSTLWIYVYYAGNMQDSVNSALQKELEAIAESSDDPLISKGTYSNSIFYDSLVIQMPNLRNATGISGLSYTTEFDKKSLLDELNKDLDDEAAKLGASYNVKLTNAVETGALKNVGGTPSTQTISESITAALSIKKEIAKSPSLEEGSTGDSASYTLTTQVGYTPTSYVNFEDHVTSYLDGKTERKSDDEVSNLADNIALSDLVIVASDATGNNKEDVYKDGAFQGDWTSSALSIRKDLAAGNRAHAGTLFSGSFKKADGSDIAAGTIFTITYTCKVNMDKVDETTAVSSGGFRSSENYSGAELAINNSALSERPYESVDGSDSDSGASTQSFSLLSLFGLDAQADETAGGTGGEIKDGELRVWPTADLGATYLAPKNVIKNQISQVTDDNAGTNTTSFLVYEWSGNRGKDGITVNLNDQITFYLNDLFADNKTMTEKEKKEKRVEFAQLMSEYFSIKNIKVYATSTEEPTAQNPGTVVWEQETLPKTGSVTKDNMELTRLSNYGKAVEDDDSKVVVAPEGFVLNETGVDYNRYIATTYDIVFDAKGFSKAAVERGLLTETGFATGTTTAPSLEGTNTASDGDEAKDSTEAKIEISSSTFEKKLDSSNKETGEATWTLKGNTGAGSSTITISDELVFDGKTAEAAKAATSLEVTSITVGDSEIALENANIAIDGVKLTVTLTDVPENTNITVIYTSALDKSTYVEKLAELKLDASDGTAYTIKNNAIMAIGDSQLSDSTTGEFEPNVGISAEKSVEVATNGNSATYTATASAGDADRTAFTMKDALDAGEYASVLKLTDFTVSVTDKDGYKETYTADNLPEGFTLTATLNAVGKLDWTLVVDKLAAGSSITASYTVTIDHDAYEKSDFAYNISIPTSNALAVSTADGSKAGGKAEGSLRKTNDVTKTGTDAGKSTETGNPLITWTFDINLANLYSADELADLKNVMITDALDERLEANMNSVKVKALTVDSSGFVEGEEIDTSAYEASVDDSNVFTVKLNNPASTPIVRVYLTTEVKGSIDDLENKVDLSVNGETKGGDTSEKKDVVTVTQYGRVTSANVATWIPQATKTLDGEKPANEQFSFIIEETDANGTALEGGFSETVKNDADGNITFGTLRFKSKPVVGTHYYKIYEDAESVDSNWISADTTEFLVKVDVAKGEDGNYTATPTIIRGGDSIAFKNTSLTAKDTSVVLKATKTLTGSQTLKDGQFSFELKDARGTLMQKQHNKADGSITFDEIPYSIESMEGDVKSGLATKTGEGKDAKYTYKYTISEVQGDAAGYTYDASTHTVTVTVSINAENQLVPTVIYDSSNVPVFENTYTTEAKDVTIQARKVLNGGKLTDGQFTFKLVAEDGTEYTATNDADGLIKFAPITFDTPGTYTYGLTELAPTDVPEGYTYDSSTHTIVVVIKDDGAGKLYVESATADGEDTATTFINTYTAPKKEEKKDDKKSESKKEIPQTGDDSNVGLAVGMGVVGLALVVGGLVMSRKRS